VKETDLHAEGVILEPIASGLACLSFEEKKNGVVLVDIGGGTSDVAIFMDGKPVFTRVIPIGGQAITKDISNFFNITEETAETLKKNHGTCIVSKSKSNQFFSIPRPAGLQHIQIGASTLAEVIHARLNEDILKEVKTAIEQSGYNGRINSGLVLTGGGSSLRDIRELFQYTLNLPVRIGVPGVGFVKNFPSELQFPMYSTVLGLLKYGIEGLDEMEQFENTKEVFVKEKKKNQKQEKEKSHRLWDAFLKFTGDILEKTS
jgi:cell division protein FtsA